MRCCTWSFRSDLYSIGTTMIGVYYGQCSEICGTNHAFMPIVVEALSLKENDYIESLAIEKSSVGFCNALLERVRSFQSEHYNNGNPTPFPFDSEEDQAKLFSIMWEYSGDQDKESFFFTTCRTERALSTKESDLILLASGEASRREGLLLQ
ncbi:unnamed protein product [Dovyalis caffra]|uniref:Cytochrome c oxidase polypeptide II n=1 Tax=Dovyalis caffra TaxID=77055 RepID=A0AAV1R4N9_9ROSI|nr:unnamed protein product [Dovyalis caffra]